MRIILTLITIFTSLTAAAQISYTGFVDHYPIQLAVEIHSDGYANAVYACDKHDTPIIINGALKNNTLTLYEKNRKGAIDAKLIFKKYSTSTGKLSGEWLNHDSTKRLKVTLTKTSEIDYHDNTTWKDRELMQSTATDKHYFKVLVSQSDGGDARITGVKIYEKITDRFIQKIDFDCQLLGLDNVSVGDYNFDGITDFSVFESSYAGPNTSSIYILQIPNAGKYFVSDFSGTSLEFDAGAKLIYEHNQCCAGRSHMNATYKVVNNKMVLVEKKCREYDEEKDDFIEKECE